MAQKGKREISLHLFKIQKTTYFWDDLSRVCELVFTEEGGGGCPFSLTF